MPIGFALKMLFPELERVGFYGALIGFITLVFYRLSDFFAN